jgi:tyrosyl-tRNA synthetase
VSNQILLDKDDLSGIFKKGSSVYIGFDPTAESIHLGNYMGIVALTHLRMSGLFQPIVVFGGATALIGDPSGRLTERDLMTEE